MKNRMFALAVLLLCLSGPTYAQGTPQDLARQYFDAFKFGDMESIVGIMHEEELVKFRDAMMPVIAKNLQPDTLDMTREAVAVRQMAGRDSLEKIQAESPGELFLRFLNWMNRMNPVVGRMMAGATIETLGYVEEWDMAHVVCRITMKINAATVSQMKVISAKKQGGEWRLMLTGEVEGMSAAIQPPNGPEKE